MVLIALTATLCGTSSALAWKMPGSQVALVQLGSATAMVTLALLALEAFHRHRSRRPAAAPPSSV